MHLIWLSFMVDTWPCELLFGGRLEKPWAWQLLHPLWSRGAGILLQVRVENTLSIINGTIVNSINKDKRKPNILELPRFYLSKNKIPSCLWMSFFCFILTLLFEGDRRLARVDKQHSWDCSHFVFTRLCHSLYVPSHMVHWCQAWCPNRCSNTFVPQSLKSPPPVHQLGWNCRNFSGLSDINLGTVVSNLAPWAKAETDLCHVFGCNGIRIIFYWRLKQWCVHCSVTKISSASSCRFNGKWEE